MEDDSDSPVQPILNYFKDGIQKVRKLTGTIAPEQKPDPQKKVDTSWHDDMVKQANDAFRKQAEDQQQQQKVVPDQKTVPVRKDVVRKRVARKR